MDSTTCGRLPRTSAVWKVNHRWSDARLARLLQDHGACQICGRTDVEVHHRTPVGPAGYHDGCQHHQDNLQTLCVAHHREADTSRRHVAKGKVVQLRLIAA